MPVVFTLATPECVRQIKIQSRKLLIPCPVECNSVSGRERTVRYVVAQTVLDLVGDLLSKYTRFKDRRIIADTDSSFVYSSQAHLGHPGQAVSKGCLRFFLMSYVFHDLGYHYSDLRQPHGQSSHLGWEFFFIIIAAEIGVILTAVTAFCAFFVSRHKGENRGARKLPELQTQLHCRSGYLLKLLVTPSLWRSKMRAQSASGGHAANE